MWKNFEESRLKLFKVEILLENLLKNKLSWLKSGFMSYIREVYLTCLESLRKSLSGGYIEIKDIECALLSIFR